MLKQWMEFEISWARVIFVILSSSTDSAGRLTLREIIYSLEIHLSMGFETEQIFVIQISRSVARCFLTLDGCGGCRSVE